jgi:hypothetical protein
MNYGRLVGAAAAATVVDAVYGYLVYGVLLASEFARYPDIYRPPEFAATYLPPMFLGIFIAMFAAVAIYAKGYEGGSGMAEGVRFGAVLAFFVAVLTASVAYGTLNIGRKLTLGLLVAGLVEWLIVGIVIGLVYKPSIVSGQCRPAAGV